MWGKRTRNRGLNDVVSMMNNKNGNTECEIVHCCQVCVMPSLNILVSVEIDIHVLTTEHNIGK